MTRRRLATAGIVLLLLVAGLRLAVTQAFPHGYRFLDDYNVALEVTGASPTWRAVTKVDETGTAVTIGVSEIFLKFGPGFGDERIAYVNVTLQEPLGTRRVFDASTGAEIPRLAP